MYSEKIIEEFNNPQNFGVIKGASGVGKIVCDIGNEIIKFFVTADGRKVVDVQFQTFGGVVAIALSSFATKMMLGKTFDEIKKIQVKDLLGVSGEIPESKMYIAQAVVNAMHDMVDDCEK